MLPIGFFVGSMLVSQAVRYMQGTGAQLNNRLEIAENPEQNAETAVNQTPTNQTFTRNQAIQASAANPRPALARLSFFRIFSNILTIPSFIASNIGFQSINPTNRAITNSTTNQNQPRNTIQVEQKIFWVYEKLKDKENQTDNTDLQNLYAKPSNTTENTECENPDEGFQKLGAKLLKEALAEEDKFFLRNFYKFMNSFPTKLLTSYNWKTSREIRLEFGKKLIIQSTLPEGREAIISHFFEEKDKEVIRNILSS